MDTIDILCIGEVLVDFIYEVSQPSVEDKKSLIYGETSFINMNDTYNCEITMR